VTVLETVQTAALAEDSAKANTLRDVARRRADQVLATAHAEAAALLADRRARAERLADLEEHERLAKARTQAAATVRSAQRTVVTEARMAARAAARRLVGEPRYELLLERLAADARRRLRDGGPVRIEPAAEGGFVARAGSWQIDYSLDAQVDRHLDAMASEVERLWR
jgi:vacuolar-type H+-ATPase subunit E/Vma4